MGNQLTRFRIQGLHKVCSFDIPIADNKLILIGENGAGKSTVANFMYYFLTCQWHRMLSYNFDKVIACFDSEEIAISFKEILSIARRREKSYRLPSSLRHELDLLIQDQQSEHITEDLERFAQRMSRRYRISFSSIMEAIFERWRTREEADETSDIYAKKAKDIRRAIQHQILFLPTYRRIEQDLRAIRPDLAEEVVQQQSLSKPDRRRDFVEFVEFGMHDVEQLIQRRLATIKNENLGRLNSLTGAYLHDVIQGSYQSNDPISKLKSTEDSVIKSMFERMPREILSDEDKSRLTEILTEIREATEIKTDVKIIAHFLAQLIDIYEKQQKDETEVRRFVEVCNNYLAEKKLTYDSLKFDISIRREDSEDRKIEMSSLSSGEKQIVSLFAHVYLSGRKGFFIIIDEPELSLSVKWQRRLLPSLEESGKCGGLVAVTHSPFIYENEWEEYAHSLNEFVEAGK